jgi:hypothetical protein
MTRFTFLGVADDGRRVRLIPDGHPVREGDNGPYVIRARTERAVPLRCTCGHHERHHGTDRRGRPLCFGASTCGCNAYTPETR